MSSGNVVTFTNGAASVFTMYINGQTSGLAGAKWNGQFGMLETVAFTSGSTITLQFSKPASAVGTTGQLNTTGAYTLTMTAFDSGNNQLSTVTNAGFSTGKNSNIFSNPAVNNASLQVNFLYQAPFVGLTSTTANIDHVVITCSIASFAIGMIYVYHGA